MSESKVTYVHLATPVSDDMLRQIKRVRMQSWRAGIVDATPAGERDVDEHDLHADHFIALGPDGEIVAAARACIHAADENPPDSAYFTVAGVELPDRYAFLNRLVVLPTWRGQGLATGLLRMRLAYARARGCDGAVTCVRDELAHRYQRLHAVALGTVVPVWLPAWKLPDSRRQILLLPLHG